MTRTELISRSPEETHALGRRLGEVLQDGDFVGLTGDLGAGKTHFVRGVAEGAGVPLSEVSSPTFSIVQPYEGRLLLHHADLYRLHDADELYATGFHELVSGPGAMIVEWVEQIPEAAPQDALRIRIEALADESRRFQIEAMGLEAESLLSKWILQGAVPSR